MNPSSLTAATPERAASEEEVVRFLSNPASYPHHPRQVRMVQTHASFVFIAPPFVYKLKKPVNFGFLDFSTLEKRRHFCEREIILNRRLCPDVYLDVVPVSMADGRLALGQGDCVVDYTVRMQHLDDENFFHQLVAKGEARAEHLDRITAVLTRFYQAQRPTAEIESWGRIDRLKISTDENFQQTESFVGQTISSSAFAAIRCFADEYYRQRSNRFEQRIRDHWIRDCHGDLHLEHIHITPRAIHIFDCIEFNDRLRYVDVASDIAFLAMDLDYHGRPDLARHFVTAMATALHDRDLPRLMNFYKCYRAYVRGKVESLRRVNGTATDPEPASSADRARRYFKLALRYAVAGSEPLVLVVMGRIASGKSAIAQALAAELDWECISSDRVRKQLAEAPLYRRSSAAVRSKLYAPAMTEKTYERLFTSATEAARAGRSVILDATFSRSVHRRRVIEQLRRQDISFCFIEAQADDETVKERLKERATRADEISDARIEDFEILSRRYEAPVEIAEHDHFAVDSTGPLENALTETLRGLVLRCVNAS